MRRNLLMAWVFICVAPIAIGGGAARSNISLLPDGTLSGNVYANDSLGLTYEFPNGWAAKSGPQGALLDPRNSDAPANQCSKVLLWLDAPGKVEGRFSSIAILLAIDPSCFSKTMFPQSLQDKDKLGKVADKIIKPFSRSPFFSPYGVEIQAYLLQGHVVINLVGGMTINAIEGRPAATKEPLKVNTSFSFTESNGYWIAWAYTADDPSAEALKNAKLNFKGAPTP